MLEEYANAYEELADEQLETLSGGSDADRRKKVAASLVKFKQKG